MATWDRYTQGTTGLEVKTYLGDIFTIRSYCDDPDGGVFIAKAPTCKLKITPLSTFLTPVTFAWDISQSVSSTGTIASYDIDFDGSTTGGDVSSAAWSGAKTGNNAFTAAGHYTVVASVTDTLGKESKEVRIPMIAIGSGGSEGTGNESLQRVYIGTTDTGCWIMTPTADPAAYNTGLSGDDLKFRDMRINPYTVEDGNDNHHLWAATKTGVAYTLDGAANWSVISPDSLGDPVNDAGDSPAPVTADLDQIGISLDPASSTRVYCLRCNATRSWIYYSDDYGASWNNNQINAFSLGAGTMAALTSGGHTKEWISNVRIDTDKSLALYTEAHALNRLSVKVIDTSTTPPTIGARADVFSTYAYGDLAEIANVANRAAVAYMDHSTANGIAHILTVSGTTITVNAPCTFDSGTLIIRTTTIGMTEDGSAGCVAYQEGSTMYLCRLTVSGTTITADARVAHSDHSASGHPIAIEALDDDRLLFWYIDVGGMQNYAQVIDVSSTISQGTPTPATLSGGVRTQRNTLATLSSTKAAVIFIVGPPTPYRRYMSTIDIDVSNVVSFGVTNEIQSSGGVYTYGGITKISSTTVATAWPVGVRIKTSIYRIGSDALGNDTITLVNSANLEVGDQCEESALAFVGNDKITTAYLNQTDENAYAVVSNMVTPVTISDGGIPGSILI